MGEKVLGFTPSFNHSVSVEPERLALSSDSGALMVREALESSGVMAALEASLTDPRDPHRVRYTLADQMRLLILQRAMGWNDLSDSRLLEADPLIRLAASSRRGLTPFSEAVPAQATLSRLLNILGDDANIDAVHTGLLSMAVHRLRTLPKRRRHGPLTLDIDGLPISVAGEQVGSAYSGYVRERIYYPLIASLAEEGDLVGGLLREGNAGAAEDADTWIPHLATALADELQRRIRVRFDAGFTGDDVLTPLETRGIEYLGRLRSHTKLQELAAPYLKRPPGRRPEIPREWCHDLQYQGAEWPHARRVVLVVQERPDDLFLHHFWIVTNLDARRVSAEEVLALYRRRGKAEAHMGELKSVLGVPLSSTDRGQSTVDQVMARNEVNLLLSLYAYQAMHALRCLLEDVTQDGWSLCRLREQVLKVAAVAVIHARRVSIRLGIAAQRWWGILQAAVRRRWQTA